MGRAIATRDYGGSGRGNRGIVQKASKGRETASNRALASQL
jgi:hypothetical protein